MALDKPLSTIDNPNLPKMQRTDVWWIQPLLTFIVFLGFGVYATWRAFENGWFAPPAESGLQYLSPFYSPEIPTTWMIAGYHFSPALFILPFPLLFRATCYYYRKAYYRAFFADPTACAVREPLKRKGYTGEQKFPLVLQNIHRYTLYFAIIIIVILWWDTLLAFTHVDPATGHRGFYLGLGSLIFLANIVLLSYFTFSCNSFRHLSGGCLNCFSCSSANKTRHTLWQKISHLNENHGLWAWLSLFSVMLTDLYVRELAQHVINDIKIIGG